METKGEHRILDIYANLSTYIPAIFLLINDEKFLKKVILRHQERILYHGILEEDGKSHFNFTCFLDMIFRAVAGDYTSVSFLWFIENVIQDIYPKVNPVDRSKFREKLKNIVSSYDLSRSYHLDWIGEIFLHQLILKTGNVQIELEKKLGNGRSADFVLKGIGNETIIEVFSIDFRGKNLTKEQVKLGTEKRIQKKILDKFKNVDKLNVILQVIIWADPMFIIENIEAFIISTHDEVTVQFTAFFGINNDKLLKSIFYFGPIENILKFLPINDIDELALKIENKEFYENGSST